MTSRIDLDELSELINIPEFERIIYHKIEELKFVLADKINMYRNLKHNFKKTAYGHMHLFENETPKETPVFRFELHEIEDSGWHLSKIEPNPPEGVEIEDIIPRRIIKHIIGYETNHEKIYRYVGKGDTVGDSMSQTNGNDSGDAFTVEFSKFSENHILGTIRRAGPQEAKGSAVKDLKIIKADWHYEKNGDEENFRELFHYMQKYPEIKNQIFSEFFHRTKPRIDNQILNVTLS